ncbi:hypothetical protein WJX74_003176 [Apatococcus lobatus]|uniref:Uncharacterized protein n=1 Tax=Apatococcus lobatus TaxID=904363 RepID=A0AAW1QD37_9CHLO
MLALAQRGCVSSWGCTSAPSRQTTVCVVRRKGTKDHAKTRPKKLSASAKRHRGGAIYAPLPPKPAHFEILSGPEGAASTTSSSSSSSPAAPGSDNEPSTMAQTE